MDSTLSPILAALVMSNLLHTCIEKLPFQVPLLYQYVDDLILAIPYTETNLVLQTFNSFDQYLEFTIELEENNSIPFLDTKIIRTQNNSLILDWYQKPTSSGRYINYYSEHNFHIKLNLIKALKNRIEKITHPSLTHQALHRLYKILLHNSYPRHLIIKLLFSSNNSRTSLNNTTYGQIGQDNLVNLQNIVFASLPFIPNLTHKLTKIFNVVPNLKIAKYYIKTNKKLFSKLKDKIDKNKKMNVIYCVECLDCPSVYIGQTMQSLQHRLNLHRSDVRLRPDRCALAQHASSTGHSFGFLNTAILDIEANKSKRLFLEMCYIQQNSNSINKRSDIQNLSSIYCQLLQIDSVKLRRNNTT